MAAKSTSEQIFEDVALKFIQTTQGQWSANVGWVLKHSFHDDKKDSNTWITI